MNIADIKKRVAINEISNDDDIIDLSPDVNYLLSIIEEVKEDLEKIFKNAYIDVQGEDAVLMLQMSGNIAEEAIKAIRGN